MKFNFSTALLVCAIAIAAAQDPNTAGGQAGSRPADNGAPPTPPPVTALPPVTSPPDPNNHAPNNNNGAPSPPSFAAPPAQPPASGWAGNPAPVTASASGSFGSAGDIEAPVTKKPKRITDSSESQSSSVTPTEGSGASVPLMATGGWATAMLLGLAAML